jgi:hypothetical protein
METEGSLSCSQEPSTGPYHEPDQSNPHYPILSYLSYDPFYYWLTVYFLVFPVVLSLWLSHQYPICIPLRSIRATCPADLISIFFRLGRLSNESVQADASCGLS